MPLCGLLEPVSGKICRNGRPANAKGRLRSSFLVMQDMNYQLFSDSVQEEVLLGAATGRCDAVLQALGLDGLADRHPMSLSGGQKQRVVVAAAMLSDKPLILLDEPTSGLDLGSMQQVGRLAGMEGAGQDLLVITHDEELAANWCDRVIRGRYGRCVTPMEFHPNDWLGRWRNFESYITSTDPYCSLPGRRPRPPLLRCRCLKVAQSSSGRRPA